MGVFFNLLYEWTRRAAAPDGQRIRALVGPDAFINSRRGS
jgi:hypothetical protein